MSRLSGPQRKPWPQMRPPPIRAPLRRPLGGWGPWPYPVFTPMPYPSVTTYQPQPEPDSGLGSDVGADADADLQGEAPSIVARAIKTMLTDRKVTSATAPVYVRLGTIDRVLTNPAVNRPGLYLIEFMVGGVPHAYSGEGGVIRDRLQDHLRTLRRWGADLNRYTVYVAANPAYAGPIRRQVESSLHDTLFSLQRNYLTNRQREMEFGEPTSQWTQFF